MGYSIRRVAPFVFCWLLVIACYTNCFAQVNNLQSLYFQNPYITNPAMAGLDKGLNLNLGYQQQFNAVPGSPKLQSFTADYGTIGNVGLGINVNAEQNGLINDTRLMGTYAYHLPLSAFDRLNFGLSLGFNDTYIDYNSIVGNQGDISVNRFNQRSVYVDGDLGLSYTGRELTVQAAVPNLRSVFFKQNAQFVSTDAAKFFTAISYKFLFQGENDYTLEPIVAYRGITGSPNIFDAGVNLDLTDYNVNLAGMYHSNNSATFSFGLGWANVGFLLAYTFNTTALKTYANNTFEAGFKLKLGNRQR